MIILCGSLHSDKTKSHLYFRAFIAFHSALTNAQNIDARHCPEKFDHRDDLLTLLVEKFDVLNCVKLV